MTKNIALTAGTSSQFTILRRFISTHAGFFTLVVAFGVAYLYESSVVPFVKPEVQRLAQGLFYGPALLGCVCAFLVQTTVRKRGSFVAKFDSFIDTNGGQTFADAFLKDFVKRNVRLRQIDKLEKSYPNISALINRTRFKAPHHFAELLK
jgi:hypothetical protein